MFKGVFIAPAHHERELIPVSLKDGAEVEPIALRLVISHEARSRGEVEQAIVAVHGVMELAQFGVGYVIGFGPQPPYPRHSPEQSKGAAQAAAGPIREPAQQRRRVPRVGVPVREEPAIEDENAAYVWPARGFAPLRPLKPAPQVLQDDKRG